MLVIGTLTAADAILLRSIFNAPIAGSNEFLSTIFAVAIAAVLASGLSQKATLEVDFLKDAFGPRTRMWARIVGQTLFCAVLAISAWRVVDYTINATMMGKITMVLQWPMWPFLIAIAACFALCVPVQFVVVLSMISGALGRGRREGAAPPSDMLDSRPTAVSAPGRDIEMAPGADPAAARVLGRALLLLGIVACVAILLYLAGLSLQSLAKNYAAGFSLLLFLLLWLLILLFVPVAAALMITALIGTGMLMGYSSALNVLGSETVGLITNEELAVLPLFMIMGAFATVAGLSSDIYNLAHAIFARFKGGLALATIGGCAGFGALTGTSLATVATIGGVALPEMKRRGYSMQLSTGTIVAGGTLGQLVPPSTAIVLYAILVEESIGRLYIAVLVPAILTAFLYCAAIAVQVGLNPKLAPGRSEFRWGQLLSALYRCTGAFVLFAFVIGGLFLGIFTATEAAAVGATFSFIIALARGKLNRSVLGQVIDETTRATSMLYFVIIGAMVISFFFGTSDVPQTVLGGLTQLGLSTISVLLLLIVVLVLLGTVMDSFTIMIVTAGLAASIVRSLGYDPIWWGIMMVIIVELGVVTPPFGMNIFVMKSMAGEVSLGTLYRGVLPFVAADIVKIGLLISFPVIVLWLPNLAFR